MIRGVLNENSDPLIDLDIVGGNGAVRPVTFLVDTGCDSQMVLPPHIVRELALEDTGNTSAVTVASGGTSEWAIYRAYVYWHGAFREVAVLEADCIPLIGMAMLDDPAAGCADLLVINSADRSVSIRHQPPPCGAEN